MQVDGSPIELDTPKQIKKGKTEDSSVADTRIVDSYLLVLTLDVTIDRARLRRLTSFDLCMPGSH